MDTTYQLKFPLTLRTKVAGQPEQEDLIEEVTIRHLKAKDLRMLDAIPGRFAQSLALIGAVTGLNAKTVDDMDVADIEAIGGMVGDFFQGARDWRRHLAELAAVFHFPPSELWEMDVDEMMMWREEARRLYEGPQI